MRISAVFFHFVRYIRFYPVSFALHLRDMKRLLSLILVTGILMQVSGSMIQLLEYSFNKGFIAAQLCIKKDVPGNGCQGKCHLKKELQKETERESDNPQQSSKSSVDWQVNHPAADNLNAPELVISNFYSTYSENFYPGYPAPVFHPPGC